MIYPLINIIISISSQTSSPKSHQNPNLQLPINHLSRREFLNGSVALLPLAVSLLHLHKPENLSWDPTSPFRLQIPRSFFSKLPPKDTPALRAGNVQPYQFMLPPTWKLQRVAHILSGNYCKPKCAEPWVVKFQDEKQGKVQVVASPLIRLTNKPDATIEERGTPEKYYKYVLETPFAHTGSHNLAKATAKGSTAVLFVASANDKQWPTSEKTLQAILGSFVG